MAYILIGAGLFFFLLGIVAWSRSDGCSGYEISSIATGGVRRILYLRRPRPIRWWILGITLCLVGIARL